MALEINSFLFYSWVLGNLPKMLSWKNPSPAFSNEISCVIIVTVYRAALCLCFHLTGLVVNILIYNFVLALCAEDENFWILSCVQWKLRMDYTFAVSPDCFYIFLKDATTVHPNHKKVEKWWFIQCCIILVRDSNIIALPYYFVFYSMSDSNW